MTDEAFERELAIFRRQVEEAIHYLYAAETINETAKRNAATLRAINLTPTFWRTASSALYLAAIVAGSATRYQFVGKHVEGYEAAEAADGLVSVYVRGTLHGRWLDGSSFDGIRFIDRFEIRGSLIERQDVWNDAGELRNPVR